MIKVGFKLIRQTKRNSSAFRREWLQSNKLSNIHFALIRRQVELKRAAGLSKPRGGVELASQLKWGKTRSWEQKVVCSFLKNHSWREKKRLEAEQALTQTEKQSKCKQRFGSRTKDYIVKLPSATPLVWLWSKNSFFGHGKTKSQLGFSFISSWCKKTLPAFILIVLQQQTWTNTTPRHRNRHSEPMKPRGKRYQTIKKC